MNHRVHVHASDTPTDELIKLLRAGAKGHLPTEAAIELLIDHDCWLHRADLRKRIRIYSNLDIHTAHISWDDVHLDMPDMAASASEISILLIAGSLASGDIHINVWNEISSLSERNTALVMEAIAHAKGWHERRTAHTVTGTSPDLWKRS